MNNRSEMSAHDCCAQNVSTHKLHLLLELYKLRGASPQEWEELEDAIREFAQPELDRVMQND